LLQKFWIIYGRNFNAAVFIRKLLIILVNLPMMMMTLIITLVFRCTCWEINMSSIMLGVYLRVIQLIYRTVLRESMLKPSSVS
jgi:hypothetical protein